MQNLEKIIADIKKAEKVKNKNILELNKLLKYSKKIRKTLGRYDSILFFIQPRGKGNISYEDAFKIFLKRVKNNPKYNPIFIYPEIEKINIENINAIIFKLDVIKEKIKKECICADVYQIILEFLEIAKAKVDFLKELKLKNFKKAFELSKIIYGDVDKELFEKANKAYKEKIKFLKNRPQKSELEKKIERTNFGSIEVKKYFELALKKSKLKNIYKVLIDNNISSIKINKMDPEYHCPTILIPFEIKVNGMRLLQLIAHEIGKHAITNYYHRKQGLVTEIGKNWSVYSEGLAKKNENEIKKIMLGKFCMDIEIDFSIYYILAIEKIKKGWNFNKVYKYIYKKCYKENLYDCGYYSKKNFKKKKVIEKYCEKRSIDMSGKICMRVFRGFDPKKGRMYFPKDKVYFEGMVMARELNIIKSMEKLEKYLYLAKAEAKYIPILIKIGGYSYDKNIDKMKNIAEYLWNDKKFRDNVLKRRKIKGG